MSNSPISKLHKGAFFTALLNAGADERDAYNAVEEVRQMSAQIADEKLLVHESRFDTIEAKIDIVNKNLDSLRFSMKESIDSLRWTAGALLLPIYGAIVASFIASIIAYFANR